MYPKDFQEHFIVALFCVHTTKQQQIIDIGAQGLVGWEEGANERERKDYLNGER